MITIKSLENAIERIDSINRRFGITVGSTYRPNRDTGFAKELQKATEALESADISKESQQAVSKSSGQSVGDMPEVSFAGDTTAMIEMAAKKYNVDPRLVAAVAETESNGNQDCISEAGAIGVMQLMPDTAASLGVNPYDKQQNIEGGAKYLREMLDTFDGDLQKSVAAYNAGPNAVKKYGGIPPYRETQNYVNKVLDIYW